MIIKNYLVLTRLVLSVTIAFTSIAGFILYKHELDITALYTFVGIFLFSASASVINSLQEKDTDALMSRTNYRFIAINRISKPGLAVFIILMLMVGSYFLILTGRNSAFLLAMVNIIWYNLVYTPLKKKTVYALIIGAVTGAIPPVIGWVAAGGNIFDSKIIVIALFMFLWQIPHFWLLLIKHNADYERTGLKFSIILQKTNIRSIIYIWIFSTVICASAFPTFQLINNRYLTFCILALNLFILFYFYWKLFRKKSLFSEKRLIYPFYLYQAVVLLILIFDSIKFSFSI